MRNSFKNQYAYTTLLDVHFPGGNNTGLPPVPFRQHFPLHTLKITDISVKLNRM